MLLSIFYRAFSVADMVQASFVQVNSADIHSATMNMSDPAKIVPPVGGNKSVQIKRQRDKGKAIQEDIHDGGVCTTLVERLGSCLKNKR
jgi:hypothetical protein